MLVQPKLLTVLIANEDLAKTYTTIHSLQTLRYRNHEIICVVPDTLQKIKEYIRRDFSWMPIVSSSNSSTSTLLDQSVQYGKRVFVDAFLFIQAGSSFDPSFVHTISRYLLEFPNRQIFIPAIVRADGRGIVYGATRTGRWPYQLTPLRVNPDQLPSEILGAHLVGGVCLVRAGAAFRIPFSDGADELALLYWSEKALTEGVRSVALPDVSLLYNGPLFCDFATGNVPDSWYRDSMRYIKKYGTWYDKYTFWLTHIWRRSDHLLARLGKAESALPGHY